VQVVALWLHGRVTDRTARKLADSASPYYPSYHGPGEDLKRVIERSSLCLESILWETGLALARRWPDQQAPCYATARQSPIVGVFQTQEVMMTAALIRVVSHMNARLAALAFSLVG
jgi:hypothetical protein